MNRALVNVILPLYNGRDFVAVAIRSVLAQTYTPFELLVIDDGSVDGGMEVVPRDPRIRYFRQDNAGVAAARNLGIRESDGELITFIDQDDIWVPEKLQIQVAFLQEHPEIDYVIARQKIRLAPGVSRPAWLKPEHLEESRTGFLPGTLMVRRKVFDDFGLFNPSLRSGSDSDWFFRVKDQGVPMQIMDQIVLLRNIHRNNHSHDTGTATRDLLNAVRQSIIRRRKK